MQYLWPIALTGRRIQTPEQATGCTKPFPRRKSDVLQHSSPTFPLSLWHLGVRSVSMLSTHTPLWTTDRSTKCVDSLNVDSLNTTLGKNMFCCWLLQGNMWCPSDSWAGLTTRTSRKVSVTPFLLADSRTLWKSHSYLLLSLALFIPIQKIHINVKNTNVFYIYGKGPISCGPEVFSWISKAAELAAGVHKGKTKITLNSSPLWSLRLVTISYDIFTSPVASMFNNMSDIFTHHNKKKSNSLFSWAYKRGGSWSKPTSHQNYP